ncbi:MAG: two-component sensor histidine kinase [Deltaproteobacteria bacterium]|nr:two-component sensor histidine kinase [Deltaproteobacteria bacterium]
MTERYYRVLRIKLIIMALCFSLIPLLALGVTIYYLFSAAYSERILGALRTLAQNRARAVELFLDERCSQLVTVAHSHPLSHLSDESHLARIFTVMQSRSTSLIDIGVIDDRGNHLAYVGPYYDKLKGVNYAHEGWFLAVMSTGLYVSDVFLGFRGVPHFVIAVAAQEGTRTWILRATINSEVVENIVRGGMVGKTGDAFIINTSNVLQTAPRFSGHLLGRPAAPNFSSSVDTRVEEVDYRGVKSLYATARVKQPKWILVIKEDPKEGMASLFRARHVGGGILAIGALLVIAGAILTTRSITGEMIRVERERAKSDQLMVQSSKMTALGKMAAGVAHEINNPLQVISEQAGWMKDLLSKSDEASFSNLGEFQECIGTIERHVDRCRTITHRLLRFGRRMEPTQELSDVNQLLAETITFLENEALSREIRIETSYSDRLPRITSDPAQLQQIFLNILINAIDAIGKSGSIRVATRCDSNRPREIVIEVSDTGPGIPRDLVGRIFDPFFTTKAPDQGVGLGLAICHSIVEKLGGQISVASTEQTGAVFTIRLPVV